MDLDAHRMTTKADLEAVTNNPAQGGYDPLGRALKTCRDAGLECRPYALDDKVVWVRPRGE
jgi:hypothetical protein